MILYGMVIRLSGVSSNQGRNFKLAEHIAQGRFEKTNMITPELYMHNTMSYYQLVVLITIF